MSLVGDVLILLLSVNVMAWLVMAAVGLWNRHKPGGMYFACHMIISATIALITIVELTVFGKDLITVLNRLNIALAFGAIVAWFLFVVGYLGYNDRIPWQLRAGTMVGALAVPLGLVFLTNQYVAAVAVQPVLDRNVGVVTWGSIGLLFQLVSLGVLLFGLLLIAGNVLVTKRIPRRQGLVLFSAIMVPFLAGSLDVVGGLPGTGRTVGVVTTVLYAYFIWIDEGFKLLPATRQTGVRQAFEDIDAGIVVLEAGRISLINETACEYLDAAGSPAELQGKPVGSVLDSLYDGPIEAIPETVRRDGRVYETSISDLGGSGRVLLIRDITTRRERQELERQNKRLDQFAGVVSHDLRNPLGIAETYLDFAEDSGAESDFETVREAHSRMDSMIDDLLTLARAGQTVEAMEAVSLAESAAEAWENADTDECEIEIAVADDVAIQADRDRLLHVFENLFRNAKDHNEPPLTVRVGVLGESPTSTETDHVSGFFIEDDGTGIARNNWDEIFEHGYTTSDDGTGFGLSIVSDVVDAHGWDITVTDSDDGGARFEVTGVEFATRDTTSS